MPCPLHMSPRLTTIEHMFAPADDRLRLAQIVDLVAAELEALDPGVLSGDDAARAVALFARLERLAVAGRTLPAERVAECETRSLPGGINGT